MRVAESLALSLAGPEKNLVLMLLESWKNINREKGAMADNMGHIALTQLLLKKPRSSQFDTDLKTTLSFAKTKMGIKTPFRNFTEQLLQEANEEVKISLRKETKEAEEKRGRAFSGPSARLTPTTSRC